ncbi:MAG: homocysteine S-methyltransferase family protein, partial [Pseudomonadota bacterium]
HQSADQNTENRKRRDVSRRCQFAKYSGDPCDLANRYAAPCERLPNLRVLGGCCGTDPRHIEQIARRCVSGPVEVSA